MLGENALERLAFQATIAGDAIKIEDDGKGQAGVGLDLLVQFQERALQDLCQQRTQCGFSCSAQADEGDAKPPQRAVGTAELLEQQPVSAGQVGGRKLFKEDGGLFEAGEAGRPSAASDSMGTSRV